MAKPGRLDRAAGAIVGMACGDALGAPYEFGGPYPADMRVEMKGGGPFGWAPGEWTDDTSMAIPLLELATSGDRMRDARLGPVVLAWLDWMRDAKDVGNQTSAVLGEVERRRGAETTRSVTGRYDWSAPAGRVFEPFVNDSVRDVYEEAHRFHDEFPDRAGNGSLMRTAPVALGGDEFVMYAHSQSALTHMNRDAMEACLIWSAAIAHAVETGELDLRRALWALDEFGGVAISDAPASSNDENTRQARLDLWTARIDEAESHAPEHFTDTNGWVVAAFQAAWSAITHAGSRSDNDPAHVRRTLESAVRAGGDTDTVAAIAGALVGAAYGVSAIPLEWQRAIHGWPGWRVGELIERAVVAAQAGMARQGWPTAEYLDYEEWGHLDTCVRHPHDPGVYLGAIGSLDRLPDDVDAVVSLCRVGRSQVPSSRIAPENHIRVWLVDSDDAADNQHVDFVLTEAADMVARLRAEGRVVLLHCVQAHSRTPSVGALYAARHRGVPVAEAVDQVVSALPMAYPNVAFQQSIRRIMAKEEAHE